MQHCMLSWAYSSKATSNAQLWMSKSSLDSVLVWNIPESGIWIAEREGDWAVPWDFTEGDLCGKIRCKNWICPLERRGWWAQNSGIVDDVHACKITDWDSTGRKRRSWAVGLHMRGLMVVRYADIFSLEKISLEGWDTMISIFLGFSIRYMNHCISTIFLSRNMQPLAWDIYIKISLPVFSFFPKIVP